MISGWSHDESRLQRSLHANCLVNSIVGIDNPFFKGGSHLFQGKYISANDVIAFYLYLMNKMQVNAIKIAYVLLRWFHRCDVFFFKNTVFDKLTKN